MRTPSLFERYPTLGFAAAAVALVLVLDKAWDVGAYAFGTAPRLAITPQGCTDTSCMIEGTVRVHPLTRDFVVRTDDGRETVLPRSGVWAVSPPGATPLTATSAR